MSTCRSCNKNINEQMLMCPYCGAHNQPVVNTITESSSSSPWLANTLLLPIWFFAAYAYVFVAAAHGRGGLFAPVEWCFALLQIAFPVAYLMSLVNHSIAHIPGLLLVAQIAATVIIFLVG